MSDCVDQEDAADCPDCGVGVGNRHQVGCDVALCKGCGSQALQCHVHASMPMTVWTGLWPGKSECITYGGELNDLTMKHAMGELVWNVEVERLVAPLGDNAETAERLVEALVAIEPFAWSDDSGLVCGLCGGFELPNVGVVHQPGCLLLRARRWEKKRDAFRADVEASRYGDVHDDSGEGS